MVKFVIGQYLTFFLGSDSKPYVNTTRKFKV